MMHGSGEEPPRLLTIFVPCAFPASVWYKYGGTLILLYLVLPHIIQKGELALGLLVTRDMCHNEEKYLYSEVFIWIIQHLP